MKSLEDIISDYKYLKSEGANWQSYYQDLADFALPRKAWVTTVKYKGERLQFNFLYDSTAIRSLKIASSGFHSNLTNQSTRWFSLETRNKKFMDNLSIRKWFRDVEDNIYTALNSSNFDPVMQEFYTDALCFGTGSILIQEDPLNKIRFTSIPVEQLNISEDANGRVNEMYREFKMTATQSFRLWGGKCGKAILEALENKPYTSFTFLHYCGPRHKRDVQKTDRENLPWQSSWISLADQHLIDEGGYEEFPYAVGRFYKDANDVMGYSPLMDVLADIKLINAQKKTTLRRGMKEADPPLSLPSRGFMAPLNLNPAALNYRDEKTAHDAVQAIGVGAGNFSITQEVINETKDNIEQGLFVPLFRSLSDVTKQMTIPEVQHRIAETMVLLGPAVGRMTHEVHSPILIRVFNILYRLGELPPPPAEIAGQEWDIVYLGPLAKAQKGSDVQAIQGFLQTVGAIAEFYPDALDNVDADKAINVIHKIQSVTPEILKDEADIKKTREARAKQQQMAQALDVAHKAAAVGETATSAEANTRKHK